MFRQERHDERVIGNYNNGEIWDEIEEYQEDWFGGSWDRSMRWGMVRKKRLLQRVF